MFRAEIVLRGATPHEQRFALAEVLRSMADHLTLNPRAPIAGAGHAIMNAGNVAGTYRVDDETKPRRAA
jgi:hypothetical protein